MATIAEMARSIFRAFVTDGVSGSGAYDPPKPLIQSLFASIDGAMAALALVGMANTKKTTLALLNADLAWAVNTLALVYADGTAANNGLYIKSGASGSGAWANTGLTFTATVLADVTTLLSRMTDAETDMSALQVSVDAALLDIAGAVAQAGLSAQVALNLVPSQPLVAEAPARFTATLTGDGYSASPIVLDAAVTTNGRVHKIAAETSVAPRDRTWLWDDRVFQVNYAVSRVTDGVGEVDLCIEWLDQNKVHISSTTLASFTPTVSGGVYTQSRFISKGDAPEGGVQADFIIGRHVVNSVEYANHAAAVTAGAVIFTRSTATAYNRALGGQTETQITFAADVVGVDNSGLLNAPRIDNYATYSSQLNMWAASGCFVTPNSRSHFDGTTTADKVTEAAGNISVASVAGTDVFRGCCWAGGTIGKWVAVGDGGLIRTYDLGTGTYTTQTSGSASQLLDVCFSPPLNLLVAVGVNTVLTSPDAVTWTSRTATGSWNAACWLDGLALFLLGSGGTNRFATSPDGTTWTTQNPSVSGINDVVWCSGFGKALAVGAAVSPSNVYYSSSGTAGWTAGVSVATGTSIFSQQFNAVAYSLPLNMAIAVASTGTNRFARTVDGINWTYFTGPDNDGNSWTGIAWDDGLGAWVAVASGGTNRIAYSNDGYVWTLNATNVNMSDVAANGAGILFAAGNAIASRLITATASSHTLQNTTAGSPIAIGDLVVVSGVFEAGSGTLAQLALPTAFSSSTAFINVDLAAGTVVKVGAGVTRSGIKKLTSTKYRVFMEMAATAVASAGWAWLIGPVQNGTDNKSPSYSGTGKTFYASSCSAHIYPAATPVEQRFQLDDPFVETTTANAFRSRDTYKWVVPNGSYALDILYIDGTTQTISGISVAGGAGYTLPVTLNKRYIWRAWLRADADVILPPSTAAYAVPFVKAHTGGVTGVHAISIVDVTAQKTLATDTAALIQQSVAAGIADVESQIDSNNLLVAAMDAKTSALKERGTPYSASRIALFTATYGLFTWALLEVNGGKLGFVQGVDDDTAATLAGQVKGVLSAADPAHWARPIVMQPAGPMKNYRRKAAQGLVRIIDFQGDSYTRRTELADYMLANAVTDAGGRAGYGILVQDTSQAYLDGGAGTRVTRVRAGTWQEVSFSGINNGTASLNGYISNGTSGQAGLILTLTGASSWKPRAGCTLTGSGVVSNTKLGSLISGTAGAIGATYAVTVSQATGTSGSPIAMTLTFDNVVYPTGRSGFSVKSTGGTDTISNLKFTDGWQSYVDLDGSFVVKVDGATVATVNCTNTGLVKFVAIPTQTDAVHTIVIDQTGSTGENVFLDLYTWRAGASGVIFNHCGHSGSSDHSWGGRLNADQVGIMNNVGCQAIMARYGPDAVFHLTGTNDADSGFTLDVRTYAKTNVINVCKAIWSRPDLIIIPSPESLETDRTISMTPVAVANEDVRLASLYGQHYFGLYDFVGPYTKIVNGSTVPGQDVAAGTTIVSQISSSMGPINGVPPLGALGVYQVSVSQTVGSAGSPVPLFDNQGTLGYISGTNMTITKMGGWLSDCHHFDTVRGKQVADGIFNSALFKGVG